MVEYEEQTNNCEAQRRKGVSWKLTGTGRKLRHASIWSGAVKCKRKIGIGRQHFTLLLDLET